MGGSVGGPHEPERVGKEVVVEEKASRGFRDVIPNTAGEVEGSKLVQNFWPRKRPGISCRLFLENFGPGWFQTRTQGTDWGF